MSEFCLHNKVLYHHVDQKFLLSDHLTLDNDLPDNPARSAQMRFHVLFRLECKD